MIDALDECNSDSSGSMPIVFEPHRHLTDAALPSTIAVNSTTGSEQESTPGRSTRFTTRHSRAGSNAPRTYSGIRRPDPQITRRVGLVGEQGERGEVGKIVRKGALLRSKGENLLIYTQVYGEAQRRTPHTVPVRTPATTTSNRRRMSQVDAGLLLSRYGGRESRLTRASPVYSEVQIASRARLSAPRVPASSVCPNPSVAIRRGRDEGATEVSIESPCLLSTDRKWRGSSPPPPSLSPIPLTAPP